jgi:hypothetical protein
MLRSRAQRGVSKHEGRRAPEWMAALPFETAASPPPQGEGGTGSRHVASSRVPAPRFSGARLGARSAGDRARCHAIPIHHVKQRSLLRSRRALLRPGFAFSLFHPPHEGRAERRKAQYLRCRAVGRDDPRLLRRGARPAGRARLFGAPPWRFSVGGRASISGISSGFVQRAPRSQVVVPGGRGPEPPGALVTSRGRRTPLPAPPSGSSLEDAPR